MARETNPPTQGARLTKPPQLPSCSQYTLKGASHPSGMRKTEDKVSKDKIRGGGGGGRGLQCNWTNADSRAGKLGPWGSASHCKTSAVGSHTGEARFCSSLYIRPLNPILAPSLFRRSPVPMPRCVPFFPGLSLFPHAHPPLYAASAEPSSSPRDQGLGDYPNLGSTWWLTFFGGCLRRRVVQGGVPLSGVSPPCSSPTSRFLKPSWAHL